MNKPIKFVPLVNKLKEDRALVRELLSVNRSKFSKEMQRWVTRVGQLTPKQRATCLKIIECVDDQELLNEAIGSTGEWDWK